MVSITLKTPDNATMKTPSKLIIPMLAILATTTPLAVALPKLGRSITGTIENVNVQAKEVIMRQVDRGTVVSFVWNTRTTFSVSNRPADASILKKGQRVDAIYHTPFFGKPYVSRVRLLSTAGSEKQTK